MRNVELTAQQIDYRKRNIEMVARGFIWKALENKEAQINKAAIDMLVKEIIPMVEMSVEMREMLKSLSEMMPMLDEQTHPQIEMDAVKYDIDKLLSKSFGG